MEFFCDDCWLELPPDFLTTNMVLNVTTDDHSRLQGHAEIGSGAGLEPHRQGNILKAEPCKMLGSLVYISCMDNQPHNVEKYLYAASIKADSIHVRKGIPSPCDSRS